MGEDDLRDIPLLTISLVVAIAGPVWEMPALLLRKIRPTNLVSLCRLGVKSVVRKCGEHFRFASLSGGKADIPEPTLSAKSGSCAAQQAALLCLEARRLDDRSGGARAAS
jgi:hypothetical protein